ncbi:MAG: hypothetical protein ABIS86_04605 [Streptosporangiaceae bacterium]
MAFGPGKDPQNPGEQPQVPPQFGPPQGDPSQGGPHPGGPPPQGPPPQGPAGQYPPPPGWGQQPPYQQQPPYGQQQPFAQAPPRPPGGGVPKPLLIGGAALAVILVIGLVLLLVSNGSDDKKPVITLPKPPATLQPPPGLPDPSATPPPPGQTYTKITNPCPFADKATIAKLVPFTEVNAYDSKNGLGVDNAFTTCTWDTKYQKNTAVQVLRTLKVKVSMRAADERRDAVTNANDDFERSKETAQEQANKTNFLGNPYGAVTEQPTLGDGGISQPYLSTRHQLQYSEVHARLGNILVEVTYSGSSHPVKNFLDASKDTPVPEANITQGAVDIATQVITGLKACTACSTGPAASAQPDAPETVVTPVKPVWANGTLAGLVDPCALPQKTTLDRLIPGFTVRRNADPGYTSGGDRSTANCYWDSPSSTNNQLRQVHITLTYLAARNGDTAVENGKGEYGRRVKNIDKDADKTNFLGEVVGSKQTLTNVGDSAYVIPITGKERARAEMSILVGNVVIDLKYSGGDLGTDLKFTPIDTGTAVAELKTIGTEAVATLRP